MLLLIDWMFVDGRYLEKEYEMVGPDPYYMYVTEAYKYTG